MSGINDEKEYMFEGKNFYGIIEEKGIKVDGADLTIPFHFMKKDDLYNIIDGLKVGYQYTYNNQNYVLKDAKKEEKTKGILGELNITIVPDYLIELYFKKN